MKQEIIDLITEIVPKLEGWASVEKALAMAELIKEAKPRTLVEIGVFGGRSLIPQALAMRDNGYGRIYGIDPWNLDAVLEGNPCEADRDWWSKNVDLHVIHKGFMEALWRHGLSENTVVIRGTASMCSNLFPVIDILHIDGNHTELASCRDVELYLPRVPKKRGMIWFDDCDWASTQKAIAILDKTCERVNQVGNCILFRKDKAKPFAAPYSKNPRPIKTEVIVAAPLVTEPEPVTV